MKFKLTSIVRHFTIFLFVSIFGAGRAFCADVAAITDEAQKIFHQDQRGVYQIRVIDLATDKKSVIGSGFQFSPDGLIATNYHVLSDAIQKPTRYRVEYLRHDGVVGKLTIINADVLHDIAIVKSQETYDTYLTLGDSNLAKGARIFSLGNPLDLGMSIVEGTYNGLMEKTLYRKILFSGSLNPGMSGGPALDHEGHVLGINVSTAGNEISFLVPVEYLKDLYTSVQKNNFTPVVDWDKNIESQLLENQNIVLSSLISAKTDLLPFGEAKVPGEMGPMFKCWGDSKDVADELFSYATLNCSSEDTVFLSSSHYTGQIFYRYDWIVSKGLDVFRFYNLSERYLEAVFEYENADKDDATNFVCHTDFVRIANVDWKAAFCSRRYKKYPQLHDINLSMASLNSLDKALHVELIMLGVNREKAQEFIKKFMKEIQWPK